MSNEQPTEVTNTIKVSPEGLDTDRTPANHVNALNLGRHNLNIAALATDEGLTKYTLNGVYFTPEGTIETDGTQCVFVSTVPCDTVSQLEPFMLKAKDLQPIAAKAAEGATVKVLAESDAKGVAFVSINGGGCIEAFQLPKHPGQFPNYKKVVPPKEEAVSAVEVDLDKLIPVLQQLADFSRDRASAPAIIRLFGHDKPIRIDARDRRTSQVMIAALAPMRSLELNNELAGAGRGDAMPTSDSPSLSTGDSTT